MFIYVRYSPIDFFTGCLPVVDYLVRLRKEKEEADRESGIFALKDFLADLTYFMDKVPLLDARHKGIDCILVFPMLPADDNDTSMKYGFIFKEDNNGIAHIAVPVSHTKFIEDKLGDEYIGKTSISNYS